MANEQVAEVRMPSRDFCLHRLTEGAPSLRFLQGWVAMLCARFDLLQRRDQTHGGA